MDDAIRFRLVGGPYVTPKYRIDQVVRCAVRGPVTVKSYTNALIPWPRGIARRAPSLIVCGELLRALRTESNLALCHWWGVTRPTVSKWRRILKTPRNTPGQLALYHATYTTPEHLLRMRKMWAAANTPEAKAKMSAAQKGKKLSKQTKQRIAASLREWRARQPDWRKLRGGPYRAPRVSIGQEVTCAVKGKVTVAGFTRAPIRWPYCRRRGENSPIIFGDLLKALHQERRCTIGLHWGITGAAVSAWAILLKIPSPHRQR